MTNERKVALVTGGTRGIGKAIVEALVAQNWYVVFTYANNHKHAESLTSELGEDNVMGLQADCRDFAVVEKTVETVLERFDVVHALVNNAGITRDNMLFMQSPEDWKDVLDTNLGGVFNTSKALTRQFLQQRQGVIINIASVAGLIGVPGQTNYCASKFGQIGFSRALALEVAARNIRVNTVCPGFIETDMTEELTEDQRTQALSQVPMKRFGQPQDVANLVCFLVSEQANYITGQSFTVDGGLIA